MCESLLFYFFNDAKNIQYFSDYLTVRTFGKSILKFADRAPLSAPSRLAYCFGSKFEIEQSKAGSG